MRSRELSCMARANFVGGVPVGSSSVLLNRSSVDRFILPVAPGVVLQRCVTSGGMGCYRAKTLPCETVGSKTKISFVAYVTVRFFCLGLQFFFHFAYRIGSQPGGELLFVIC